MTSSQTPRPNATQHPTVSVLIPAYNAAGRIAATLNSVFSQTLPALEVILINDGSPDTKVLEEVLQPYVSRIRYFKQANAGPSSARNLGIRQATGQYLAFLDSDDFWFPHHLERQVEIFRNNSQVGLVYANAVHLQQDRPVGLAFDRVPQSGEPTLDALLSERCTVNTSSVVVRRDLLLQAGLFDESMNRCEDFDLWLRLAGAGCRMTYDREIQVCHRLGEGLASDPILMKQGRIRAYQKARTGVGRTDTQQAIIDARLAALKLEIETELARRALIAGQYPESLAAVSRANSLARSGKLRLAMLGLRYFPRLLRNAYTIYLRVLASSKRARRAGSIRNVEIAGKSVNLDSLVKDSLVKDSQIGTAPAP
jgi:glycosyltransferase involved in cell wall biosynthesis